MALPGVTVTNNIYAYQPSFDLSVLSNSIGIPASGAYYTLLPVSGLTGTISCVGSGVGVNR